MFLSPLACAILVLGGCSSDHPSGIQTADLNGQPGQEVHSYVDVWSWNIAAKSLQSITPAFEQLNPSDKVTVDMTGAQMQMRLMLSLVAGVGAPDVCELQLTDAPHYIATGRLTNLDSVAAKYRTMFPAAVWNQCLMNGHVYAIPWDIGPCAVYYRRSIFRKYGIDPGKIETWSDYIAAGRMIVRESGGKTKMLPLGSNDIEQMYELLLQQADGQVFDNQGKVAIDSPQSRLALSVIQQMRQAQICSEIPAFSQEWMSGFGDSSIASYPGAAWLGGIIKDTLGTTSPASGDWGVFRLPAIVPGGMRVANLGGSVLIIPQESSNKAAAWAFVRYALCTTTGQLTQYKKFDIFPGFLPALTDPKLAQPDPFFDNQNVTLLFAKDVDKIPPLNYTANWSEAKGYIQEDLSHWAATGMPNTDVFAPLALTMESRLGVQASTQGNGHAID